MNLLTNFLNSGHEFSQEENLQQFRVSFLNVLMLIATFFTFLNSMVSISGIVNFGPTFEKTTLLYVLISLCVLYSLRVNKAFYPYVANFFIVTSLILFYFVLLTRPEDEFRLVAFYLGLFIAYVLLGKKYGSFLTIFIVLSIIFLNIQYDLMLSDFALTTFFTFFLIFTTFMFFFLNKVERDALEFKALNNALKNNVAKEKQQRLEQEQILLRQCRLSNMGEKLDFIAHQWRQPLMHVNAILLNMDRAVDSDNKEYLISKIDEISSLTQHMSQTIDDFKNLSGTDHKAKKFSLEALINDVLLLMKNQFIGIKLNIELKNDIIINSYKTELMQVIIILLSNAIEALNLHSIDKKIIDLSVVDSGSCFTINIKDNAGGIDECLKNKIFDPYFTTKKQSGGTGLGLYITKIIVTKKMKGTIFCDSTAHGASFLLTLNKNYVLSS